MSTFWYMINNDLDDMGGGGGGVIDGWYSHMKSQSSEKYKYLSLGEIFKIRKIMIIATILCTFIVENKRDKVPGKGLKFRWLLLK